MSIHNNPDGSITEGMKLESNATFVAHAFLAGGAITSSTAIGSQTAPLLSVAGAVTVGAKQAVIQALVANVAYRLDGVAPTAGAGMQIVFGGAPLVLNMTDAAAALFISATGGIAVTYTM